MHEIPALVDQTPHQAAARASRSTRHGGSGRWSWSDVLRDLRDRGLRAPLLAVGGGNLGIWGALGEVFPTTHRQRCWNHRVLNLMDKLPKRLHKEVSPRLYELYQAPTRRAARASATRWRHGFVVTGRPPQPTLWVGTGKTSWPSTTSPRSTGCIT